MSRKTRILCIIGQLGNGGTERQLYLFLKHLDIKRFEAYVMVSGNSEGRWQAPIKSLGIQIIELGSISILHKFLKFRKQISILRPELIYSWSFYTNAFSTAAGKIPFVGSLRQQLSFQIKTLSKLHLKMSLLPERIIVNSSFVARELREYGLSEDRIKVLPNIYERKIFDSDRNSLRRKHGIPKNAVLVLGAGRDSPSKDFPFFVDVFEKAAENMPELHACLLGSGGTAMADELAERNLQDRFLITGEIPSAYAMMPMADIFFLSSASEGMPNVILEAIDAGCAILTTKVGGIDDIFAGFDRPLREKFIVCKRDISTAAEKLTVLAENPDLRKKLLDRSRTELKRFSPRNIMSKYMKILEQK